MLSITSPNHITLSYEKYGSGPPLILVHGGFSDHITNWEFVKPWFETQFTVYAIARRGRGDTDGTIGHSLNDESTDLVALIQSIGEPVFLLGHSYGAHVALAAANQVPNLIRKLVLYEAPHPHVFSQDFIAQLEAQARADQWDEFSVTFFRDGLLVPIEELDELRATPLWPPILADAKATLGDLRALSRYDFDIERFRELHIPVLLQIGSESPRHLYITDAIAAVLPDVCIEALPGQAHEGMTTAPHLYAEAVSRFLLRAIKAEMISIKPYDSSHLDAVVRLSLRAWEPVFTSLKQVLNPNIYQVFYPEHWQVSQQQAVEAVCADENTNVWVAIVTDPSESQEAAKIVGFTAVKLHQEDHMGEIYMIAVDPNFQGRGIGSALIEFALKQMQAAGMLVAMVETAGDPGHAPARHTYEKSGFELFPVARYFKAL